MEKQIGKNWWCSLFPALCFTEISSNGTISEDAKKILQENLNKEECDILLGSSHKIKFKFKIIELLNK